MRILIVAFSLAVIASCKVNATEPPRPTVIRHVTIADPRDSVVHRGMSVVITGARIGAVGPDDSVAVPAGAAVIDGAGAYLIPGLWDMHVHTVGPDFERVYAPLLLAHGVTGIRDMGDDVATQLAMRSRIESGGLAAPRLVTSARVDGDVPRRASYATVIRSPAEAARVVDSLARRGVDLIKTYSSLPRATYFAVAQAAKSRGTWFAGHVPRAVSLAEAANAGQRSIEHTDDLEMACTSRELALKAEYSSTRPASLEQTLLQVRAVATDLRGASSASHCASVTEALRRNRTWLTPTLVVYQPYAKAFDARVTSDSGLRWMPAAQRQSWEARRRSFVASDSATVTAFFNLARVGALRAAGVPMLVGTDTPLPYLIPGASVHDEMDLLVRAGFSPRQALAAATTEPGRYFGGDTLGVIRAGARADLVLLDADPFLDVRNARRVRTVIADGRAFGRAAIDSLLAGVLRETRP